MPKGGDAIDWSSATPDQAFAEALRQIAEAGANGAQDFTLGALPTLTRLPPEIASLSDVRKLHLYSLGDIDLEPLTGMTSLQELNLNLPVADIGPLASLRSLEVLRLSSMPVVDLSPLAKLQALRILVVQDCDALTDIAPLSKLGGLTALYLGKSGLLGLGRAKTGITDLRPLAGMSKLIELELKYSSVSDLKPLSGLLGLRKVNLLGSQATDLMPLKELTDLTHLTASYTDVSDIGPLARLTSLTSLHLDATQVADLGPVAEFIPMIDQFASVEGDDGEYDFEGEYGLLDDDDDDRRGLHFDDTPISDRKPYRSLARIKGSRARTIETINEVRLAKGLPPHYPRGYEAPAEQPEEEAIEPSLKRVGDYVRRKLEDERLNPPKPKRFRRIASMFGRIGNGMLAAIGALVIAIASVLIKAYQEIVHTWIDLYLFGCLIVKTVPGG